MRWGQGTEPPEGRRGGGGKRKDKEAMSTGQVTLGLLPQVHWPEVYHMTALEAGMATMSPSQAL